MKLSGKHIVEVTAFVALICLSAVGAQSSPPTDADCVNDQPFVDPENCTAYYQCFDIPSGWALVHLACPAGGYYDATSQACLEGTPNNNSTNRHYVAATTEDATTVATTSADESTTGATVDASESTTSASSDSGSSTDAGSTDASTENGSSTDASTDSSTGSSTDSSTETSTDSSTDTSTEESTTELSTTASSDEPTTQVVTVPPPTFECTATGFFSHPTDPTKYYQCVLIGAQFYYYVYNCAPNSCFQQAQGVCVIGTCPTANSTTTTTLAPTGPTLAPINITCNTQGSYPYPQSCTKYYNCILIAGSLVYYVFECPPGSHYDPVKTLCVKGLCPSSSTTIAVSDATEMTTELAIQTSTPGQTAPPCPNEGFFPDAGGDCHSYYKCVKISGVMYYYFFRCPVGAYWSQAQHGCMVGDCPATGTSIAPPSESPTGSTSPVPFSCTQEGIFTDPTSCSSYNRCIQILGQLYYFTYTCPPLTYFDLTKGLCVIGSC
ncbi:Papilin [Orchesella cincta]|uniref:Papilin n=1 Tax=Orchesella cincta TaxID=48709 RepID=A0A1D2MZP1_ORCCI|nr:Papilin [Orchesella cincta]